MKKFIKYILIAIAIISFYTNANASISIRDMSNQNNSIDEDQIIRDMEREAQEDRANEKQTKEYAQEEDIQDTQPKSQSNQANSTNASTKVDMTFFILTLVGLVIAELVIIFTDYIKPRYFDDLY